MAPQDENTLKSVQGQDDATELRWAREKLMLQRELFEKTVRGASIAQVEVRSLRYREVLQLAERVARFDSNVLITGETGVGKSWIARHIHSLSPRASGPFVTVNCGALPESLAESELFGYRAGAFTGADRDHCGLIESAHGGVLFLDDVGDLPRPVQSLLLRALQEREVVRLGDTHPVQVDIRVIAATARNLAAEIAAGRFREDLYYRLQVIHLALPALRERPEDILPLARRFAVTAMARLGTQTLSFDSTCIEPLLGYTWPGNVRELENAVEHAAVLSPNGVIRPEYLPETVTRRSRGLHRTGLTLESVELAHIAKVLESTGGNREDTARILGIGVATLYRRLARMRALGMLSPRHSAVETA